MAAPTIYAVSVVLGGVLWPEYSHLRDPISLLISAGAPNALAMNALFTAYNVLLFAFGLGWFAQTGESRSGKLAAIALSAIGLLGLAMYFFPQDAAGSNITQAGIVHIILASAMSLLTMSAIFLRGRAEWRDLGRSRASVYSFASLFVVFVTGGLAAISISQHWAVGGLIERFTIGGFLLWVFVEAALMAKNAHATPS